MSHRPFDILADWDIAVVEPPPDTALAALNRAANIAKEKCNP
jgi:hypothetical protein